jgi:thiamine biosynthesis lipoprotein
MPPRYVTRIGAMGAQLSVSVWDDISPEQFIQLEKEVTEYTLWFDETFSRFKPTSLISEISQSAGTYTVPKELTDMLHMYRDLSSVTQGACNPLVGQTLTDYGYDAEYSLVSKDIVREPPAFLDVCEILDATTITLLEPVIIDIGALGKGYWIDKVRDILQKYRCAGFLIDGSGDIGAGTIENGFTIGLEHPFDDQMIIGTVALQEEVLCGSGVGRRAWKNKAGDIHHIIDGRTGKSVDGIVATWVRAQDGITADALSTCLFFTPPRELATYSFEYLILHAAGTIEMSEHFGAQLFSN